MARKRNRSADNVVMVVARNIRRLREVSGETKLGFAQRTGLNRSRLIDWERGTRTPTLQTLQRIANGLEVEIWELLRDSGDSVARRTSTHKPTKAKMSRS